MLANTITLDTTALGESADQVFQRYNESSNRSDYIGAGHLPSMRNMLQFYRTFPKRNGESLGVRKVAVKLTRDVAVDSAAGIGTLVMPIIFELSVALPEGCDVADRTAVHRALGAFLLLPGNADICNQLFNTLEI